MKIEEIVKEYVEPGVAQANKTSLDGHLAKQKQAEYAEAEGIDIDAEEATQDLPS